MKIIVKLIATFLGTGYSPIASGTVASMVSALLIWLFIPTQSIWYIPIVIFLIPVSHFFCGVGTKFWGKTDASQIVLDEVVGMAITYMLIPKDLLLFVVGFFLFRVYDIFKIPPAGAAEKIKGGWGVLLDDVVAGIYANIGLWILHYFLQ
ncbi:phosphatidylglycerophosphatase A [bacterium]|nr:MAG: phosphatidylglycerophosphatase A [bacterium]